MPDRLIRKLENFVRLSEDEKAGLRRLASDRVRIYAPGDDLAIEGERSGPIYLVQEGFACRYKSLPDGRRQIVGLFVPGDLCDPRVFILRHLDHSIGAISRLRAAVIEPDALLTLSDSSPRITRALWWNTLVEEAIAREWILSLGQRSAYERLAHLLCEVYVRMKAVDLVVDRACAMPLTQIELADALGISPVHTNRTLQALRGDGLLTLRAGRLQILDPARLMAAARFSANYLHLEHDGRAFDASPRFAATVVQGGL